MIRLDYRDARPIYAQIKDMFIQQIDAGILRPEDKMPSVRELAVSLAINPNTIQRAYRELEAEGRIATVPGKGSFVCDAGTAEDGLLIQFDRLTEQLLAAGHSRQELTERMNRHA